MSSQLVFNSKIKWCDKEVMEAIFVTLMVELLSTCIVPGYDLNIF